MDEKYAVLFFEFVGEAADQFVVGLVQYGSCELALVWVDDAKSVVSCREGLNFLRFFVVPS